MTIWKVAWKQYLFKRVQKDKVHPKDVYPEMLKKFKDFNRSYAATESQLRNGQVPYKHLSIIAERKRKPKPIKEVIEEETKEIKLKQKVSHLSKKYQIVIKEKAIGDRMVTVLERAVPALPKINTVWQSPSTEKTSETAVLLLGDLHIGEIVERDAVYGFGEYNFDVFVRRLKLLADSIKSVAVNKLRGYSIKKLVIFGMGDMVSGRIHDELIENAESVIFQVLNGAYVTAQFILELKLLFPEIEIDGVLGNHGRLTSRVRFKRRYENWDYIYYQFLALFLANNGADIKCNFPKSFFTVKKIYDWNFLVMHGDAIRSWMRIPWYGIERTMWRLGDLLQGKGINVQYRMLGHFHNTGELDKVPGEMVINGSMIGGTEFSLLNMAAFDRPTQLFFGVHKEIGMTWRYPLRLDLPKIANVKPYAYNKKLSATGSVADLILK